VLAGEGSEEPEPTGSRVGNEKRAQAVGSNPRTRKSHLGPGAEEEVKGEQDEVTLVKRVGEKGGVVRRLEGGKGREGVSAAETKGGGSTGGSRTLTGR